MTLEKGDLLTLTADDIGFLSKYVVDYRRKGNYKLRPHSFEHFLSDSKYRSDDTAELRIPLVDLIDVGALRKIDVGGFKYWELGGRVLNPKEFVKMYKVDDEVYRTLFKEWGLLEVYERFKDAVNGGRLRRINDSEYIAEFTYAGVTFLFSRDGLSVHTSVGYNRKEAGYEYGVHGPIQKVEKNVSLSIRVKDPKPEDVDRVLEYIEYTDMLVKEMVDNLRAAIKESTGLDVDPSEFTGIASVDNYRLIDFRIGVHKVVEMGRSTIIVDVNAEYDKRHSKLVEDASGKLHRVVYPKWEITVETEGKLKSLYVYKLFRDIKDISGLPDDVNIALDTEYKEVKVMVSRTIPAITFFDMSRPYEVARNFREVLLNIAERNFEKMRSRVVKYSRSSLEEITLGTFGEMLDSIKWFDTKDFDEVVLKLIALTAAHGDKLRNANIPVIDFFIAHAVIRGMDQDSLTKKVNDPLETMIEFIESGKIRVRYENTLKIYFKGRPIEEYISPSLVPGPFGRLVSTALSLAKPDEAIKVRMKVPS